MPYTRVGSQKVSDHDVRSPLLNINRACQTCHKWSEDGLRSRAEAIQERTFTMRNRAMDALMALIDDINASRERGAADADLTTARERQRRGQFYLDFIESENSNGFHAPEEAVRVLGEAIDYFRQGQVSLRTLRPSHQAAVWRRLRCAQWLCSAGPQPGGIDKGPGGHVRLALCVVRVPCAFRRPDSEA